MTVPAYCCAQALMEGDDRHVLVCPEARSREPQPDTLFDLPQTKQGGQHL